MQLWRNAFLVKTTLLFFTFMLLFNPAYAGQARPVSALAVSSSEIPVVYLSEAKARVLLAQLEDRGYRVREGTLAQLEQVSAEPVPQASDQETTQQAKQKETTKKQDCKADDSQAAAQSKQQADVQSNTEAEQSAKKADCEPQPVSTEEQQPVEGAPQSEAWPPGEPWPPVPGPLPPAEPPPAEAPPVNVHFGVHADIGYHGGGGRDADFAKVFFIFAGVMMVAAFIVYAGDYVAEIVSDRDTPRWTEVVFNSTFMDTERGRSGEFYGARLATGFVSNELIQLALVGEVGNARLNLIIDKDTAPTVLDFSATYWLIGASARLHLRDAMKNASYLFLDLLGGGTNRSATELIGAARFGVSFGIDEHWRLGASLGAQYIGLDEDQGFRNDGSNYWTTIGVELGARF